MNSIETINDRYLQMLAADPNACVELGLEKNLDQLPDQSLEELARTEQMASCRRSSYPMPVAYLRKVFEHELQAPL